MQSKYAAAASSASRVRRWHRARTLEARLSRSRLALNLHLPAAHTVPATHVGGEPPCAARTCLLRSRRRRSARCSSCTLFNNRCVLSACSCVSQNTHRRRASAVRFSAFRLPNPTQTRRGEVHGGLWPKLNLRDWSRSGGSYGNNTRVICCPAQGRPESAAWSIPIITWLNNVVRNVFTTKYVRNHHQIERHRLLASIMTSRISP